MVSKRLFHIVKSLSGCSKDVLECLNVTNFVYKALKEIAYNILYTELPLTPVEKQKLRTYKGQIRSLAKGKLSKTQLTKLLKTEFVEVITQPIIRMKNGNEI